MDQETVRNEIVKATPPVGVTLTAVAGVPLSDWVYIATIVYIVVQCVCLVYRTFFKKKGAQ